MKTVDRIPTTLPLPEAVAEYLEATNRFDPAGAAACFTPDAIVHDEQRQHVGTAAIQEWMALSSAALQARVTPVSAQVTGETVSVVGKVTGNFPGSPVELEFQFRLQGGKISHLNVE